MSYTIVWSIKSEKQFAKLPLDIRERITGVMERVRLKPHSYAKRLAGLPYYSVRAGDYRIIIRIIDNELIVFVIELGNRRNVY